MTLILASEFDVSFKKLYPFMGDLKGKTVLLIITAALGEGWTPDPETHVKPFEDKGAIVISYDLKGKTQDDVRNKINQADLIYVSGGNTFYLLKYIKATGFADRVKQRLADGLIYIGSSAGSIVACPDIDFIAPMDDPSVANLKDTKGLGLVDFLFLPHLDHAEMGQTAHVIKADYKGNSPLFALKDDQAIIVDGHVALFV